MVNCATILSASEALYAALQFAMRNDIFGKGISSSDLKELLSTTTAIRAVLRGLAGPDQYKLSHEDRSLLEKMANVVYDADDLFDEYLTVATKQQLRKGGNVIQKVRHFFSSNNPFLAAHKLSSEIKKVKKRLDEMASAYGDVADVDQRSRSRRRFQTAGFSSVYDEYLIGRDEELAIIIEKLLLSRSFEEHVGCVAVVGVGGLGKTALAQLVYNDQRVCSAFSLRFWVSVSNQDKKPLEVKEVFNKILEPLAGSRSDESAFETIQSLVQEKLEGARFLLILDDVWDVSNSEWVDMIKCLSIGGRGSMILVTTRSHETASIVRAEAVHELRGLYKEDSWHLFQRFALESDCFDADLIQIGKDIAGLCYGIPLALRAVGSILSGQHKRKWVSFRKNELANFKESTVDIMEIFKLSFHYLEGPLKSCFSYVALFPNDLVLNKDMLINLWMAQGYIVPFHISQSITEAGEEYFFILLERCLFQVIDKDEYGEVVSCKVHAMMHDVAKQVAAEEVCVTNAITENLGDEIRHLCLVGAEFQARSFAETKIRSYLLINSIHSSLTGALVPSCIRLRALDLRDLGIEHLPDSIGNMLHLRYIDLSGNVNLKALPNYLSKLFNLETLNIDGCDRLKELPEDLSKLVNLQNFYVQCQGLTYMPAGMDKLTRLCVLTSFVVANNNSSRKQQVGQLKDLGALKDLHGCINISIPENFVHVGGVDRLGVLQKMAHLKAIRILFHGSFDMDIHNVRVNHEALLKMLQPHSNLRGLILSGYQGVTMAVWGRDDSLPIMYPNLVEIELRSCQKIKHLPLLRRLRFLKSLKLHNLRNLEYIESSISSSSSPALATEAESTVSDFYPSLEQLELVNLPKLQGWQRGIGTDENESVDKNNNWQHSISFPRLSWLTVKSCPDLTSFPPCPSLASLSLRGINEKLRIIAGEDHDGSTQMHNYNDWDKELETLPEADEVENALRRGKPISFCKQDSYGLS